MNIIKRLVKKFLKSCISDAEIAEKIKELEKKQYLEWNKKPTLSWDEIHQIFADGR